MYINGELERREGQYAGCGGANRGCPSNPRKTLTEETEEVKVVAENDGLACLLPLLPCVTSNAQRDLPAVHCPDILSQYKEMRENKARN